MLFSNLACVESVTNCVNVGVFVNFNKFIFLPATAPTYYCKDKETINIEGESTGIIHTVASGAGSYGNNVDCSWKINAGDGNQLHMKILSSNLEYTPPYTSCFTRDSLFILEGNKTWFLYYYSSSLSLPPLSLSLFFLLKHLFLSHMLFIFQWTAM